MLRNIRKRDNSVVKFDQDKISQAVYKAMEAVGVGSLKEAMRVSDVVVKTLLEQNGKEEVVSANLNSDVDTDLNTDTDTDTSIDSIEIDNIPTIEQVQDVVERTLMSLNYYDVAKVYILYRDLHTRQRNVGNLLDVGSWINSYIARDNWKVHSDSEIDYHLQGLYKKVTDNVSEKYWMNEVYDEEMRRLHYNKDFHIHKSSSLSSYCVGWDIQDILLSGFRGVHGNVTSAPAKHLRSALGQLVNFMYTLTNESPDGAVAVSSVDTYLAPFIRHDELSYNEVKQCVQEFIYNMNMPTKSGGQVVFSNITLDLEVPNHMKNEAVIIGGEYRNGKYGDFEKEVNMFNHALVEVYAEGDANGRAFTFPIPTYNITKNFDWDNENLVGLWEMTAKYGIPYFANFINSDMDPEDARSMCCRLRIDNRTLQKRGGGFFGANPLTGSIGYVTINLPRLGYKYANNKKGFLKRLGELMDVANKSLILRRKLIEELTEKGLYPYSKFYLRSVKKRTGKYWSNHFSTIGLLGMNEAIINFFGSESKEYESKSSNGKSNNGKNGDSIGKIEKLNWSGTTSKVGKGEDITTPKGQKFAKEVLDFMNDKLLKYQKSGDVLYNLEASPAEGASYSIAKKDKELFPDIVVANEDEWQKGAEPYYTNSTHLPVGFTDDIFEALDLQDELQCKYTGGTVFHGFLGERINNGENAKNLVRKIAENYKLPYFTLTPTFSICPTHGYLSGEHFNCPKCSQECYVYSRVVGKIAPVQRWNPGKKSEFKGRKEYLEK